ncbi:magnesium transporter CorA family protein [Deinococcus marmoris]|uniref:Magnesium and cobalt transport protein CorA n=1 Tax=Deinococcus marmoris TaxID=249408 RepID=A0A1U7NTK7_9DEIO|nr:CorA family divalent cation transporter [Deinococcus marmoris]OLV16237.1 Magnesium and cobalt transport protein CorA [Deinococcus marmoris]
MTIRAYLYDVEGQDHPVDFAGSLPRLSEQQLLWIDVVSSDGQELEQVASAIHLDPDSLQALRAPLERPDLNQFKDSIQVNVTAVEPTERSGVPDFTPIPLVFLAGKNYLVTVHAEKLHFLDKLAGRVRRDGNAGTLTSADLLAVLLGWHLENYFQVLENLEEAVDDLDAAVLERPLDKAFLSELVRLRRRVGRLRRTLIPHREVFSGLTRPEFWTVAGQDDQPQFGALESLFERAVDTAENTREVVLGSFDLYTAWNSHQTNDGVQVLTVVTVALGIISAVAGIMGTNFALDFFKSGPLGFFWMLLGTALLIIAALLLARRRHWV